jgi:hypothetical protein
VSGLPQEVGCMASKWAYPGEMKTLRRGRIRLCVFTRASEARDSPQSVSAFIKEVLEHLNAREVGICMLPTLYVSAVEIFARVKEAKNDTS